MDNFTAIDANQSVIAIARSTEGGNSGQNRIESSVAALDYQRPVGGMGLREGGYAIGKAIPLGYDLPVSDHPAFLRGNARRSQRQITDRCGDGRSGAHEGHSVPPENAAHHARILSRGATRSLPADAQAGSNPPAPVSAAGMAGATPKAMPAVFRFERQRASIVPALLVFGLAICVAALLAEAVL
jgi:hypothetical protein